MMEKFPSALFSAPPPTVASPPGALFSKPRYLTGLPVTARPDTIGYRMQKFVQRHRLGVMASTAFLILLIGFAVTTALQSRRIDAERQVAQEVSLFMKDLFAGADPFSTQTVQTDTLRSLKQAEALPVHHLHRTALQHLLGQISRAKQRG